MQGQPQHLVLILTNQRVKGRAGTRLGLADQVHLERAALRALLVPARLVPARVSSRFAPPIALVAAMPGEDCTLPLAGQAKASAAWARLIEARVMEALIASAAIAFLLLEEKACA